MILTWVSAVCFCQCMNHTTFTKSYVTLTVPRLHTFVSNYHLKKQLKINHFYSDFQKNSSVLCTFYIYVVNQFLQIVRHSVAK